jgi:hypothetical protein
VVVAVVAVREVQVAVDQVADVVAVRDGFVAAVGAVDVALVVRAAVVRRRAFRRVLPADGNGVFVDVILVRVVQMPVMQVIDMPEMFDGGVTAAGAVNVVVIRVSLADAGILKTGLCHVNLFSWNPCWYYSTAIRNPQTLFWIADLRCRLPI